VLNVLARVNALNETVFIDVIEGEDRLWNALKDTFQRKRGSQYIDILGENSFSIVYDNRSIKVQRLRVDSDSRSPYTLPYSPEELLRSCDRLKKNGKKDYDLVVASHVTYYFSNAGANMAYAIMSRLLGPEGWAWFVVRDRDCQFYKYRDEILKAKKLPDFNREYFSDAFLDRMKCLIEDNGKHPSTRPLTVQRKTLSLVASQSHDATDLVQYLYWLNGLTPDESTTAMVRSVNGLSESHIWMQRPARKNSVTMKEELGRLAGVQTIGKCIDVLRSTASSVAVHRASLARIGPADDVSQGDAAAQWFYHLPVITFNRYKLYSIGYAYEKDEVEETGKGDARGTKALREYFNNNPSFLYYQQFFDDYRIGEDGTDFSTVKRLECIPLDVSFDGDKGYTKRHVEHLPIDYQAHGADVPFYDALDDLNRVLADYHGVSEVFSTRLPDTPELWSICIGCNILNDPRAGIDSRNSMNTASAIFLTVSSREKLDVHAQCFVGHMKALLGQWLAEHLHDTVVSRNERLRKFQEMLAHLGEPLNNLTAALGEIQNDAQKLRSVLYDFGRVLFDAHSRLSPLYEDGRTILVTKNFHVTVAHLPDRYTGAYGDGLVNGQGVLSLAVMTIFGKERILLQSEARTVETVVCLVAEELSAVAQQASFAELTEDLFWLFSGGEIELDPLGKEPAVARRVQQVQDAWANWCKAPQYPLDLLKKAVHYPFKPDNEVWYGLPLLLGLKRHLPKGKLDIFSIGKLRGIGAARANVCFCDTGLKTPATYEAVLRFAIRLATAQQEQSGSDNSVRQVSFDDDASSITLKLVMAGQCPTSELPQLKKSMAAVLCLPRDWRLRESSSGNFRGPFIDFASSLLGIRNEPNPSDTTSWATVDNSSEFVILELVRNNEFIFTMSVTDIANAPDGPSYDVVLHWGRK